MRAIDADTKSLVRMKIKNEDGLRMTDEEEQL